MEDFKRSLASPASINKRSQSDLKQKMRFLRGKENEGTPKKHFMSPTFSASSKVRKKLSLIEKNEQEEEDYNDVTFSAASSMSKNKNVIVEKHQDYSVSIYTCEFSVTKSSDSTKPYDPYTNCLTPRPNFLMYNPLYKEEMESSESNECLTQNEAVSGDGLEMGSTESQVLDEFVVNGDGLESSDFEEDSDEEIEEEKKGVLYKVMKLVFVVSAIVISTLYISSTPINLAVPGYFANDFALGSAFLNQTVGKELSFREATESVILGKLKIGYDQIHYSDEGEVGTGGLDQVSVNENVVGLAEKTELVAETLSLPYATDIQSFLVSLESTDEVLFNERVTNCEDTREEEMVVEDQVETVVNMIDITGAGINPPDAEIVDRSDSSGEFGKMEEFSYKINSCEVPGAEEMIGDHQGETVVDTVDAISERTNPLDTANVDNTDSSGESAKMEEFSYKIDEKRVILDDILNTCEVVDSLRVLSNEIMSIEEMKTDVVLAMGGIASVVGGTALLALTLKLVWRMFMKPSERVPPPVTEECVKPVLLPKKDYSAEKKEQFAVEQRLIELCHFRENMW